MKKPQSFLLICLFFSSVFLLSASYGESTCYEFGYKWGMCFAKTRLGMQCKPENDIIIPERCRDKEETKRGAMAGAEAVGDVLNLDKGDSR